MKAQFIGLANWEREKMLRMLIAAMAVLLAAAVALTGCGQNRVAVTSPSGTEVRAGQEFTITLDSNPTTGYQWQLGKPLDENIVKLVSSKYKGPVTSKPGAGGEEGWTFRAEGTGKAEIALKYVRPWEKDMPAAKEQTYEVIVK